MDKIIDYIFEHRKGIMGTIIVHLVFAIIMLSVGISNLEAHKEHEIIMDFESIQDLEKQIEQKKEELKSKENELGEIKEMLKSTVANENAENKSNADIEQYINEIQNELNTYTNNASKYKFSKDKNFNKDSIQDLMDKKKQKADSLKSTFYSGESSVSYNLKDRYARHLPIPVYKCERGGKVQVSIYVDRDGHVMKATIIEDSSIKDENIREVALEAALSSAFNKSDSADNPQKGLITYIFVKQ